MLSSSQIRYLGREEIDDDKWNTCIDQAGNGLIYAYSYYLDKMASQWSGLVLGDYLFVMPLTWNRKYGIAYLYQPFLTAQLGIFGNAITAEIMTGFLQAIPSRFRYWDFYLNHKNVLPAEGFTMYERSNFILNLNKSYEDIYKGYRENIQRNIRKSTQLGCISDKNFPVDAVIELAVQQMRTYTEESKQSVEDFRELYKELYDRGKAMTYGIRSAEGKLLSSCVFFFSHNRAYYILVGNHPDGRTLGASHALIDAFIKDHAGRGILLDFEGSDIRNLAFFYSSFGSSEEKFAGIKLNKLPFYLKWLKK